MGTVPVAETLWRGGHMDAPCSLLGTVVNILDEILGVNSLLREC